MSTKKTNSGNINTDLYKEYPNQNFVEQRFNNKSFSSQTSDECYMRYKNNAHLMGQVFSIENIEETKDKLEDASYTPQEEVSSETIKELYANITEELGETKDHYLKKIKGIHYNYKIQV